MATTMKYGIYFTRYDSSDNYQTSLKGWYNKTPYKTLNAAKSALEGIACVLNEVGHNCYKCIYKDRLTLVVELTDNLPQPTTFRIIYCIRLYHL